MSSPSDAPANACWLKSQVAEPVFKRGVKACWPPGSQVPEVPKVATDELKSGSSQYIAKLEALIGTDEAGVSPEQQQQRADYIRDAMRFVWGKYKAHAWGRDNLMPLSGRGTEAGFSQAVTMVSE